MVAGTPTRLLVSSSIWLIGVGGGVFALWQYESEPGKDQGPALRWPDQSELPAPQGRPALVVFAHPKCPCSRATLAELGRLLARTGDPVRTHVVFVRPPGSKPGWEQTALWETAKSIPGTTVAVDSNGAEAARFGAKTSGYTLLYGADGRLQFSGGITGARGHAGDNPGEDAVISLITTGRSDRVHTPVFGCTLLNEPT